MKVHLRKAQENSSLRTGSQGNKVPHLLLTVVVMVSSVTTFRVSTTEMYPRRRAMARAVFPFWQWENTDKELTSLILHILPTQNVEVSVSSGLCIVWFC